MKNKIIILEASPERIKGYAQFFKHSLTIKGFKVTVVVFEDISHRLLEKDGFIIVLGSILTRLKEKLFLTLSQIDYRFIVGDFFVHYKSAGISREVRKAI